MNSSSLYIGPDSAPDRYRLLNSIGRGGEAVLYRAELQLDGAPETVVVKVLDSKRTVTLDQFERLSAKWNEQAELLRFVRRPGVVGVREHFEGSPMHLRGHASTADGRALVLVMNHVEGLDLRDWRAERTLVGHQERREVSRVLEQLADVLDWLHSGGATPSGRPVVHGDLSPGNIMVDSHGQATLVDFGLSKLTAEHHTAEVWFTPGYAAPEVFEGKRTPGADRYAFGAVAYHLLSGQAPPASPEQLRAAYALLPQVAALAPLRRARVLAICSADPAERPESLRAWVGELRDAVVSTTGRLPVTQGPPTTVTAAAGAQPPTAPPGTAPAVPRKPRSPLVPVLAVALAVAVVVIGVLMLTRGNGSGDEGGDVAAPGPTATVTGSAQEDEPGTAEPSATTQSPSDGATAVEDPDTVSLSAIDPISESGFEAAEATLAGKPYADAMVMSYGCDGGGRYNLGRGYKKFSLVLGIEDSSEYETALVTIELDGKALFKGTARLGDAKPLELDVEGGLRLRIAVETTGNDPCMWAGKVVLGTPTLSR
ncbi:NPCBM/NEW2 domain-containing protein [Streptomyces sp. Ncost-T6T-1]|uniref:protein kinase domain-containing protein n=1 Tax=Streptomyces sp. Ncost-T6T-1 TaxID=1100828 RepID=UPI000804A15E|nr:protein kinase [Streptomyces sp. Ncost-T6T-1]SBU99918.1 NPCBM/NEW2 domain-containing protein [Streptomyces sp. Ncost-T6T-1]